MFYMKHKGKRLLIESDNVYTTCPLCGKEHVVNLQDILGDRNGDLYGTAVYCEKCSAQREQDRVAGKRVPWPTI